MNLYGVMTQTFMAVLIAVSGSSAQGCVVSW